MIHEQIRVKLNEVEKLTADFYKKHADGYQPKEDDIMQCTVCGRKADVLNKGSGPLVCCGKPMIKIGEAVDRHPMGETSVAESMAAVMGCRAAKNSIALWQRRLARATDEGKKLQAKRMIAKFKMKVYKCKKRGMMI